MLNRTILLCVLGAASALGAASPPAIASVAITPNAVTGGETATGTLTLATPSPVGGATIALSSNNTAITVVSAIQIAQGQTSATFQVATVPVSTNANATLTATSGSTSASTTLTVNGPCVSAISLKISVTSGVTGSGTLFGTVDLNGPAPSGGTTVNLVSGGGNIGSLVVPQGKGSAAVNLNLADLASLKGSTVTAQTGSCTGVAASI